VNSTYETQQSEIRTASIPGAFRWYFTSFMRGASDRLSHEFVVENALSPVYDKFILKHEFIFPGAKGTLYSP
jgi:CRISPR/Cas system CMR-associated protein Cmr1 (group 7 of RAMP superfamily)